MQISNTNQVVSPALSPKSSFDSTDFNTFLTMLTTQLKNQDPLNPVDSSDYAVQLATFSNVEQSVKTNDLLTKMNEQLSMGGISQIAGWVGLEAQHSGPIAFSGSAVTVTPSYAAGANAAVLVVKDSSGNLISRDDISVGMEQGVWQGVDASGRRLPDGNYSLAIESYYGENLLGTAPIKHYARIEEVQRIGDSTQVVFRGGTKLDASSVTALREPH